jgi:hypothetical protein
MLAEAMVDEMRIMQMNIFRWNVVHNLLFCPIKRPWFVPRTLKSFENETKWTHVLSARLVLPIVHVFYVLVMTSLTWLGVLLQLRRQEAKQQPGDVGREARG